MIRAVVPCNDFKVASSLVSAVKGSGLHLITFLIDVV